jgi:bifunctional non-homologous end joining protein LigD
MIEIDGHQVELSNLGKVFYEEAEVTKGDMIEYYEKIYPVMEPHIADRPLTLHRYPDGIHAENFYQKEAPDEPPAYVERVEIEKKENGSQQQIICNNKATLVYLANLATIEFHIWLSRSDRLYYPDKLVFDLDPPGDDFEPVREAAFHLRDMMQKINIKPYVMTTGSDGLHLAAFFDRKQKFATMRDLAEKITTKLASNYPDKYTTEIRKKKEKGKIIPRRGEKRLRTDLRSTLLT